MNRKTNHYAVAIAAFTGSLVSLPAFGTDGPYVGLRLGASLAGDQTYAWNGSQTILPVPQEPVPVEDQLMKNPGTDIAKYKYKVAPVFGYVGGFSFENGLRPEFELDFRSDKPKSIDFLTAGADPTPNSSTKHVTLDSTAAFGNLWFDLFKSSSFHPYLGGGVGVIRYKINNFRENAVNPTRYTGGTIIAQVTPVEEGTRRSDDARFAYQGGAGVRFDVTDQLTVGLDYRYVKGETGKFYVYRLQPQTHFDSDYDAQSVFLSVDWYFHKKPAPVAPVEPPPVIVAPPPPDTDGDGVIDDLDKCPGTPPNTPVDNVGCPLPPPPPPCKAPAPGERVSLKGCATGDTIVLRGVNFEFDKARLTPNAKNILDNVADELVANPQINIELGGHTDSKGSDAYNEKLSDNRAKSVVKYLEGRGIAGDRMTAKGYGETQPIADNDTDEGRELNRRVELKISGGAASTGANDPVSYTVSPPAGSTPPPADAAPAMAPADPMMAPAVDPSASPTP